MLKAKKQRQLQVEVSLFKLHQLNEKIEALKKRQQCLSILHQLEEEIKAPKDKKFQLMIALIEMQSLDIPDEPPSRATDN